MRPATVSPSSIRNRSGPALPSMVTVTSMRARPPDPAGATFPRADSALPSFIIVGGRATAKSEQIQLKSKNCLTFFFSLCFLARRGRTHDQKKKRIRRESRVESNRRNPAPVARSSPATRRSRVEADAAVVPALHAATEAAEGGPLRLRRGGGGGRAGSHHSQGVLVFARKDPVMVCASAAAGWGGERRGGAVS